MEVGIVSTGTPSWNDYPDPSHGTEVQIWGLATELRSLGHDVTIYRGTFEKPTQWTASGVTIVDVPMSGLDAIVNGLFTKLLLSRRIGRRVESDPPDLLFLFGRITSLFPSRLSIPSVYTVNSPDAMAFFYDYSTDKHPLNAVFYRYKRAVETSVCRHADIVVAPSGGIAQRLRNRGFEDVVVIPHGIRERFLSWSDDREEMLLFVGRLAPLKQPDLLLDVYEPHLRNGGAHELHLVGDGEMKQSLRQRVQATTMLRERVRFHGKLDRDSVFELMSRATGLVLPSLYEVFGLVVIEAMARGCPVVSSRAMGPASIISHGDTGYLFDGRDRASVETTLRQCLENDEERRRIAHNAFQSVKENYLMSEIAERYLAVVVDSVPAETAANWSS